MPRFGLDSCAQIWSQPLMPRFVPNLICSRPRMSWYGLDITCYDLALSHMPVYGLDLNMPGFGHDHTWLVLALIPFHARITSIKSRFVYPAFILGSSPAVYQAQLLYVVFSRLRSQYIWSLLLKIFFWDCNFPRIRFQCSCEFWLCIYLIFKIIWSLLQAHMQASFVILRVLLSAGEDLVTIQKTISVDGEPDIVIRLDRSKINSVGKTAIGNFLRKLQVYRSGLEY